MMTEFFKTVRGFILEYLPKQRGFSDNTVKSYRTALNLLVEYLREEKLMAVSQIDFPIFDYGLVLSFLDWLEHSRNCSPNSRNQRLMALRSFFKYAGIIDCTQVALQLDVGNIPIKKTAGRIVDFLTEDALRTLLRQPDPMTHLGIRNQFFMVLMYDTAARCGELLNMKVGDLRIDIKHPVAYLLGKGNKPHTVPLLDKTIEHCKRYLKAFHPDMDVDGFLFYTVIHGTRQPMSADCVARFMQKYGNSARQECQEVPLRIHPHQLRHTRAVHYYRDGMPLVLIAELLNHASVETTKIYAYADSEMKRIAMEKACNSQNSSPPAMPVWQDNEEMILKLSGLN